MLDLFGRGVVVEVVEHVGEPGEGIDAHYVATFEKGVEYGVVDGSFVVFAEEVVLPPQYCRALVALYGIVVDLVDPVVGIARQCFALAKVGLSDAYNLVVIRVKKNLVEICVYPGVGIYEISPGLFSPGLRGRLPTLPLSQYHRRGEA